jgi:hypothetical protein
MTPATALTTPVIIPTSSPVLSPEPELDEGEEVVLVVAGAVVDVRDALAVAVVGRL